MLSIKVGDVQVQQLGQGTWNMGDSASKRAEEIAALRRGIELGLHVIDTAEMYGDGRSESLVGEAIRDVREQVYLVSKVLPSHASAEGTVKACEASLKRLGVEALDLYLLHWRGRFALAETVQGFERLLQQGKIKAWGVSNFDVSDMQELFKLEGGLNCVANQVLYNPEYRGIEFDLLPWCDQSDVAVMAYSPVGQGGDLLQSEVLKSIAKAHGTSSALVALAWCMRKPVLAIPKAGSVDHVEQNAQATNLKLSSDDLSASIERSRLRVRSSRLRCSKRFRLGVLFVRFLTGPLLEWSLGSVPGNNQRHWGSGRPCRAAGRTALARRLPLLEMRRHGFGAAARNHPATGLMGRAGAPEERTGLESHEQAQGNPGRDTVRILVARPRM